MSYLPILVVHIFINNKVSCIDLASDFSVNVTVMARMSMYVDTNTFACIVRLPGTAGQWRHSHRICIAGIPARFKNKNWQLDLGVQTCKKI